MQTYPELAAVYQDTHDTAKRRQTYDRYASVLSRVILDNPHPALRATLSQRERAGISKRNSVRPSARDNRQLTDEKLGPLPRLDDHTGRLILSLGAISLLC